MAVSGTHWKKGTVGRVCTHHKSDGRYSAAAVLTHDSPPDQKTVRVELREDFYCLEKGEIISTARRLFEPD